jgi:hypothetical protein
VGTNEILPLPHRAPASHVQEVLDAGIAAWEASKACHRLRSAHESTPLPRITKIVAFANSTMAVADTLCPRSSQQHALILTLREILSRRLTTGQPEIRCFAQDPVYGEGDKEVLGRVGIAVLDDPRGFLEVDDETVVLSFCPNIPVRQIVADIARPAVMIWGRVGDEDEARAEWRQRCPDRDLEALYYCL